jgi:hypothetical protein
MLDTPFPINHGFEYYEKEDEFRLYLDSDEYLLIWEIREKWEISFVDKEDNQSFLCKGDERKILESIKQIIRDRKINYLIS